MLGHSAYLSTFTLGTLPLSHHRFLHHGGAVWTRGRCVSWPGLGWAGQGRARVGRLWGGGGGRVCVCMCVCCMS